MSDADAQLVARVQQGDKKAFDLLVLKYQHKIHSLISRYVRDHAEVQDVAQEAFIKAYRAINNFRSESAFYTWMYRIATNEAITFINKRAKRANISSQEIQESIISNLETDVYFEGEQIQLQLLFEEYQIS